MGEVVKQLWAFHVTTYPNGETHVDKPFKMGKNQIKSGSKKVVKKLDMGELTEEIEL